MKNDQYRGVSTPSFAAIRELARVSRECVNQTVLSWPLHYGKSLLLDSGLESVWNKDRLSEMFADCLSGLDNELGPAYHPIFDQILASLGTERPASALAFEEVRKVLDASAPDWSHDFIIERSPLHTTALYQVHAAIDEDGQRWLFKIIKPAARIKLQSTLNALREIEASLKALRIVPRIAALTTRIEELRRSLQREADMKLERRSLLKLKNKAESDDKSSLKFPRVLERIGSENLLVFERIDGFPLSAHTLNWKSLESSRKLNWSLQPIQASVLKAFEMGLLRGESDTEKLVMMKDGAVGVRHGWAAIAPDGSDRGHAAHLLRALYLKDLPSLKSALGGFDKRMTEMSATGKTITFVELAEATFVYSKSLGIELPKGFVDIAKSLQSLEGIGKPLVMKRTASNVASFGYPVRSVAQEIALNSPIARARRLTGR